MRQTLIAIGLISLALVVLSAASCEGDEDPTPPPPGPGTETHTDAATTGQPTTPTKVEPATPAAQCEPRASLAPLVTKLQPSVVNIYATKLRTTWNPLAPFFNIPPQQITKERALGSGFIFNASEGLVVTNHHVVEKALEVKVRLSDRRQLTATLLGSDRDIDLAVLRVNSPEKLQQVTVGDSDQLSVGDWVLAIGNPFGLSQTVTVGIVSALSRTIGAGPYDDFIQTDASINPGNSGGPLFDMQGRVVGINTAIHREGHGIGFAIPMSMALPLIEQIRTTGRVERVYLGVVVQDVTPEVARAQGLDRPTGALVNQVQPGSPAAQAGIQPGDVILEFNGHPINVYQNLPTQVARTSPGQAVDIAVWRQGQRQALRATVSPRPPMPQGGMQPWPNYPQGQGQPGFPNFPRNPSNPGYPGNPRSPGSPNNPGAQPTPWP